MKYLNGKVFIVGILIIIITIINTVCGFCEENISKNVSIYTSLEKNKNIGFVFALRDNNSFQSGKLDLNFSNQQIRTGLGFYYTLPVISSNNQIFAGVTAFLDTKDAFYLDKVWDFGIGYYLCAGIKINYLLFEYRQPYILAQDINWINQPPKFCVGISYDY